MFIRIQQRILGFVDIIYILDVMKITYNVWFIDEKRLIN